MRRDTIVGLVSLCFGAVYTIQAFQLPKASIGNPWAPIYFPATLGVLTMLLGLAVLLVDRKRAAEGHRDKAGKAKDPGYWILTGGTILLSVAYGFLFEHIGFISSTLLFLGGLLFLVNGKSAWKLNSIITVLFTLGLWVVFVKAFHIKLP